MEDLAPPENVPVDLAAVKQAFSTGPAARFLDLSGRFPLEDRQKIQAGAEQLAQKTGGKVWVLALPGKTDVNAFGPIYGDLHMAPRDVLFIFSADKRHLHSQALTKPVANEVLKATNKEFYKSQTTGTLQMYDEIAQRMSSATASPVATTAPSATPQGPAKKPLIPIEWVLGAIAIAVIVWLFRSSKKPEPPKKPAGKPKTKKRAADATKREEADPAPSREKTASESEETASESEETASKREETASKSEESDPAPKSEEGDAKVDAREPEGNKTETAAKVDAPETEVAKTEVPKTEAMPESGVPSTELAQTEAAPKTKLSGEASEAEAKRDKPEATT